MRDGTNNKNKEGSDKRIYQCSTSSCLVLGNMLVKVSTHYKRGREERKRSSSKSMTYVKACIRCGAAYRPFMLEREKESA